MDNNGIGFNVPTLNLLDGNYRYLTSHYDEFLYKELRNVKIKHIIRDFLKN